MRIYLVVGTHTHVPTADARILSGGTAYVTDAGMFGGTESIIGFNKKDFLEFFLGRVSGVGVSEGPASLSAVVIEVEVENRQAISIEHLHRAF